MAANLCAKSMKCCPPNLTPIGSSTQKVCERNKRRASFSTGVWTAKHKRNRMSELGAIAQNRDVISSPISASSRVYSYSSRGYFAILFFTVLLLSKFKLRNAFLSAATYISFCKCLSSRNRNCLRDKIADFGGNCRCKLRKINKEFASFLSPNNRYVDDALILATLLVIYVSTATAEADFLL